MTGMSSAQHAPDGVLLPSDSNEKLHRSATPKQFLDNGEPSFQIFLPNKEVDDYLLSVYRDSIMNAEAAYCHRIQLPNRYSAGIFSVLISECGHECLDVYFSPVADDKANNIPANPAHSDINFQPYSLDKKTRKAKAQLLLDYAIKRGMTYRPS